MLALAKHGWLILICSIVNRLKTTIIMKKQTLFLVILITTLTLVGFVIGRCTTSTSRDVEIIEISTPAITRNKGISHAKMNLLTKQLADAETKISDLNAQIDHLLGKDIPVVVATEGSDKRQPNESWQDHMERMKTENPEKYEKMLARREELARRRHEFLDERWKSEENRDNFFANVNIAYMSPEEQRELTNFIAEYQDLRNLVESRLEGEPTDTEQIAQLGMSVLAKTSEIRSSLLKATAKEMGYNSEESIEFAENISSIVNATSLLGPVTGSSTFPGLKAFPNLMKRSRKSLP